MVETLTRTSIHKLKNGSVAKFDAYLKDELNSMIYNINNDWDFIIIVTGDGMVRTGKSVFTMNIGAYLADKLNTPFSLKGNVFFEGQPMIDAAKQAPPNSVFIYDEAREGLATSKRFNDLQHRLLDFFNECGQLNHVFLLVLPDFFSLQWELATNRSEILLNVYRTAHRAERYLNKIDRKNGFKSPVTILKRGQFEFFSRKKKHNLYWKSKRTGLRQYNLVKPNFIGSFANNYPLNEEEYRAMKKEALLKYITKAEETTRPINVFRDLVIQELKEKGMTGPQISKHFELKYNGYQLSARQINAIYKDIKNRKADG